MNEELEAIAEKTRQYIGDQASTTGERVSYLDVINHLGQEGFVEDRQKKL